MKTDTGYYSNAYGWSSTTPAITWGLSEDLSTLSPAQSPAGPLVDSAVYRITGRADTYVQAYQQIMQGGSAGDCYVMAGWAKGDSVPVGSGRNTVFALILKFNYTDGTTENFRLDFNPDANTTNHWQYGAGRAVPKKAYSSMYLCICYDYNANTGYFDGIQVFKEEYGNSYVYDSEGRITSVTDLQKQTTSYEYANNDLVKAVTKEGNTEKAKVTYTYDSYHNVATATTLEGVVTSFTYDTYGNNTKVTRGSVYAQSTFTNSGNTLSTVQDTQGNVTTYGDRFLDYGE